MNNNNTLLKLLRATHTYWHTQINTHFRQQLLSTAGLCYPECIGPVSPGDSEIPLSNCFAIRVGGGFQRGGQKRNRHLHLNVDSMWSVYTPVSDCLCLHMLDSSSWACGWFKIWNRLIWVTVIYLMLHFNHNRSF